MEPTVYDFAVIGAGPAGATFARQAAGSGRTILLVDRQDETHKKPCGGLLAPDAQKALAHFDLVLPKDVLVDPQIFSVQTIDLHRKRIRYYQRYYLNMDRYAFDRWLISLIPPQVQRCCGVCLQIQRQGSVFRLQIRTHSGEDRQVLARQVVGADGAGSLVRRTFFPEKKILHYTAIQQWFENPGKSVPFYSCLFDETTSESCSWLIHKDNAILFGGCFAPQNARAAFEEQKAHLTEFLGIRLDNCLKTEACTVLRPRRLTDFVTGRDGVYLIGEAAGFISASSFEGISSAIRSGDLLAKAVIAASTPAETAKRYRRGTRSLRLKLALKFCKRPFMYTPLLREWILRSGIDSIRVQHEQPV